MKMCEKYYTLSIIPLFHYSIIPVVSGSVPEYILSYENEGGR